MDIIIVHRLLQSVLLPPLNAMLIMLFALLFPFKTAKYKSYILIFGLLLLYVQSIPIFAYNFARVFEIAPLKVLPTNVDTIVILGGGVNNNGYEYPIKAVETPDTFIRLKYVAYLANKFPSATVITSGGYSGAKYTDAGIMRDSLINVFDLKNTIIAESKSRNTDENGKFVADIINEHKYKNILLVTQAYHMDRALMDFHNYGIYPIPASTDYTESYFAKNVWLMFIPNARYLNITARTLHEVLGYYFYKAKFTILHETK